MIGKNAQLTRTKKKKLRTQELIIDTTMDLLERQAFDKTTMEQIADVADIAKGTLYNYYSCKEEIISAYIKRSFASENQNKIKEINKLNSTTERLYYLFDQLLNGVKKSREIFEKFLIYQMKQLVSFEKDQNQESGIGAPILVILKIGQESGEIRNDLSIELLSEFTLFVFIELVKTYYLNTESFNQEACINKSISLFNHGVSHCLKDEKS